MSVKSKNIHVLPTDKPSKLFYNVGGALLFTNYENHNGVNIYITSDEEIKEGDWVLGDYPDNPIGKVISKYGEEFTMQSLNGDKHGLSQYDSKKIILTTDVDLIKDGVQSIDDEFLEWFVKNPSCDEIKFEKVSVMNGRFRLCYKIIIPKEEPKTKCYCGHTTYCDCGPLEEHKQETLEEVSEYDVMPNIVYGENVGERIKIKAKIITKEEPKQETIEEAVQKVANSDDFINGALFGSQWQQERMYSKQETENIAKEAYKIGIIGLSILDFERLFNEKTK